MCNLDTILSKLSTVHPNGSGYTACCPAHDDRTPSLSVSEGEDGRILVHCHRGCETTAVLQALGLSFADLMPATADTDSIRVTRATKAIVSDASQAAGRFDTAHDALAALEHRHGKAKATWTYESASGELVGVVARWDARGKKTYRPVSLIDGKWLTRGMASPRPLYRLPQILAAPRDAVVLVHEGEKAADAALAIDLPSTTSAHGARSAAHTDWSPLAGREVAVFPDNDAAGSTYVADVVGGLSKLSPRPTIRIVRLPGLPEGGDIVEYIAQQRAAGFDVAAINSKVRALIADGPILNDDDDDLSWRPFPTSVLPSVVRRFVEEYAKAMDCDTSLLALPILSMLAGCIGVARVVRIKNSWWEPGIIWTAVVTTSGSMKTPALRATTEQLHLAQRREVEVHEGNLQTYQEDLARYETELSKWKKDSQSAERPTKPEPPQATRYIVSDTTVEALAKVLRDNPRGVLMERDELAGWIGDLDRYSKSQGGDVTRWLSAWNAGSVTVDRSSSGAIHIPRAAVSVTGNIQPGVAAKVFRGPLRENGLTARLLMAMPPRRPSLWTDHDVDPALQAQLGDIVDRLLSLEMRVDGEGRQNSVEVAVLNEAKELFKPFNDRHERETCNLDPDLASAFSKLKGYALRFALVIQMARWASNEATNSAVDIVSMRAAIELVEWWKHETRRIYAELDKDPVVRAELRDVQTIAQLGGRVSVREWQRKRSLKVSDDALAQLRALERAGHGTLKPAPQNGRGHPSLIFTLNGHARPDTDRNAIAGSETALVSVSEATAASDSVDSDADWGEV